MKSTENSVFDYKANVNQSVDDHTALIAAFRRAEADATHKFGLIQVASKKGPKAVQAAVETAAKAAKRRDAFAKKLDVVGVSLPPMP